MNYEDLPQYKSHKIVGALKIKKIELKGDMTTLMNFEEDGYDPIELPREYYQKHKPTMGGYYVKYKDGYESFSPQGPFEDGYELLIPISYE